MSDDSELSFGDAMTIRAGNANALGRIDQYELIRELGGGGFGTVFLARDTVAGIDVAVKGLPPLVRNNREELESIRQNFALVARLHHPHIAAALVLHPVKCATYAERTIADKLRVFEGDFLVVMEYAPGVTLSQWRKQFPGGKVPRDKVLSIVSQIADALDYAHGEKIIHRDIKPANVMVETKGNGALVARVLDFGLAAEIRSSMGRVSQQVTDTCGTRPYMAPEQWLGKKQNAATDQYALAALTHELLTGEVPFASVFETGDPVVMMNVVGREVPELSKDLPHTLRKALATALAKDVTKRFASCAAFVAALVGAHTTLPVRKWMGIGVAAILAATLAVGGFFYQRHQEEVRQAEIVRQEEARRQAAEAARIAAEKAKEEARRQAEEQLAEETRKAAEKARAEAEKQLAEEKRKAAEKARAEAEKRLAEEKRKAAEKARAEVEERLAEEKRKAAEKARAEVEERLAEEKRKAAEKARAEAEERLAEEKRKAAEKARAEAEERARRVAIESSPANRAGDVKTVTLPGGARLELVWCPPGSFRMGSPKTEEGRDSDEVQHRVTLTEGFWMGKYEVTQEQWESVMGSNPSRFQGANRPVENVSWEDCQTFCREAGLGLRLPTEAEWEYACRAGTTGVHAGSLDDMAWYYKNSGSITHDVGQKRSNAWGLYDMHGNVWEWCLDWYGAYGGDTTDPPGPSSDANRVIRGGGGGSGARLCRSARRNRIGPGNCDIYLGFRLCCSAGPF